MKKKFAMFLIFMFTVPLFSNSGLFIGEGKIFHAKTKYFDIIYCDRTKESAEKLFYNADSIYEKIASEYGHEIWCKMPVVISPAREESNGSFSVLYYPHIVIYDAPVGENTRNVTDDVLMVFSHEVTHAYTLLMENKFWRVLGNIFWLGVNAQALSITAGWTEGAAVMTESEAKGEGRLNDGWALQMLKQAKIEGVFPRYDDIKGADDKYPKGSYYYFNSFFNLWLKENYGMEKYSEFWWRCVNLKSFTAAGAFKKVYEKKLKVAWKEFQDSIDVSNIKIASKTDDIFGFGGKGFVIESLVQAGSKIAFIEAKTKSVWGAEIPVTEPVEVTKRGVSRAPTTASPKKLFTLSGIEKIAFSTDGRYIACTYLSARHANYKKQVKIYDTEKKHFYSLGETGLQDATILKTGEGDSEKYYLVALKFSSQKKSIVVKELGFGKVGRLEATEVAEFPQESGVYPYSFVDSDDGYFSYIEKSGLKWSIKTRSIFGANSSPEESSDGQSDVETFEMPDGYNIRYLARDEALGGLVFSWAEAGGFPKEARIVFFKDGSHKIVFSGAEESGGVYFPTGKFYVKKFYRESGVFRADEAFLKGIPKETPKQSDLGQVRGDSNGENSPESQDVILNSFQDLDSDSPHADFYTSSKRYRYFLYPKKGIFLPVCWMTSYETNPFSPKFLKARKNFIDPIESLTLGALYMTANPWGKGVFTATSGYFFDTKNYGGAISYSSGTDTSLFSYKIASQVEFNKTVFKENRNTVTLSSTVPISRFSNLIFSETAVVMFGENSLIYGKNVLGVTFTSIHQTGMSIYEKSGISIGASGIYEKMRIFLFGEKFVDDAARVSPSLTIRIPHLIPIRSKDFFTYNLPFRLSVQGFTGNNNYFSATGELYLFAMEIEKAIQGISAIFINRFMISAGYNYGLFDNDISLNANFWNIGKSCYSTDSVFAAITLGATPNFGQAARNQLYMEFRSQFTYRIRKNYDERSNFKWNWGLKMNFLNLGR